MKNLPGAEPDPWLKRWLPPIVACRNENRANSPRVLELGCGEGRDTQVLLDGGLEDLTALDFSEDAAAHCQARSERLVCRVHDLRRSLPFADATFDVVLASLCLHYFSWQETVKAAREIRRVLRPGGLLLCRVNSVNDVHYGATGHPEIERHLYRVAGQPKRFFDRADLHALFAEGWSVVSEQEMQIHRYEKPKFVWETALTRLG